MGPSSAVLKPGVLLSAVGPGAALQGAAGPKWLPLLPAPPPPRLPKVSLRKGDFWGKP